MCNINGLPSENKEFIIIIIIILGMDDGNVSRLLWNVAAQSWHQCEVYYDPVCYVPCHLGPQNGCVSE